MMSRDNLASMSVDNVASGRCPDMASLGLSMTSLHAVAPGYLGRRGARSHLDMLRRNIGS